MFWFLCIYLCALQTQSRECIVDNRDTAAICRCLCLVVCTLARRRWEISTQISWKSGSCTSTLSSAAGPRGRHLLLFCLSADRDFFFLSGIVILEGHLPPQRQTSLNSSGRQTVAGRHSDMSSRPPSTIVWLKLAIKIFRQSQFIQTEIKEKDFTFKSLVYRCLTLNVWRVCWLHLWSQSCSPSPPSCPDLLSKRFKGDGIFSISHHVLWKDFALIAKNWTGLEVWFCFCCCWTESLNFNLGRNTCRWRLTAVISWL